MAGSEKRTARGKSGRPKGADSEARREQILTDSVQLFIEQGYHGVTMSMVARACGISPTGLAHYFATKDQLLEAILHRRDDVDTANITRHRDDAEAGWIQVSRLVDLVRHNETQPRLVRLFTTMAAEATNPEHPARRWLLDHHHRARTTIMAACAHAKATGELSEDAPESEIARALLAVMDGLQLQYLSDATYTSMAATMQMVVDSIHARYRP